MKFLKMVCTLALFVFPLKAQEFLTISEPVAGFKNEEPVVFKSDQSHSINTSENDSTEFLKRENIRVQIDSLVNFLTIKSEEDGLEYIAPEDFTFAGKPRYTIV